MGMWRPNKGKGWSQRQEAEPANRFTQILRTVLEVVPGGVIRYGKTGPDDDAHTGFWLGVTPQSVAKFAIGGPGGWLKWDGENLHVRGALETFAGDYWPNWLAFYGADGEPAGHIMGHDAWGHQIDIATPRQDAAGDPGMITLECDGDFDALVRLRLYTERGAGGAGAYIDMQIGNGNTVLKLEGTEGNAWIRGVVSCADPTADTHAVTRRAGDARYAGIDHTHAPAELQQDAAEAGDVLTWNGSVWTPATPVTGVSDHGALTGLGDDDHLQYLTNSRADARYLRASGGWSGTIPIGAGKSLTVLNGQITNATF